MTEDEDVCRCGHGEHLHATMQRTEKDQKPPLTLEERLALLNAVMTLGPHEMFPLNPPEGK